jgi:hypothetical protein
LVFLQKTNSRIIENEIQTMPKRSREIYDPLGLIEEESSVREAPIDRLYAAKTACQQTGLQARIAGQNMDSAEKERDHAQREAKKYLVALMQLGVFGQSLMKPDNAYQHYYIYKQGEYFKAVEVFKTCMAEYHRCLDYYSSLLFEM